ncbi:MAG TPA: MFS transporter [Caulobacteraceae bacterium]|nr:MFS transporter [Caulobacteraceae bacterium]
MAEDVAAAEAPPAVVDAPKRRRMLDVIRALGRPRVALMLMLGFSSGLPFMLIGNTLGFWLAGDNIKLAAIGYLSWAGLPYLVKFIWGAVVDRLPAPLVAGLGRRRGWLLISQFGVAAGLMGMAASDPKHHLAMLAAFAVFTGVAAATQDTVIDAWRIEIAEDADELGLLTAANTLGYRAALIGTEAVILLVAQAVGWPLAYALYGGAMIVGVAAALMAREPARADAAMERIGQRERGNPLLSGYDAIIGPFIVFFRAHGVAMALLMLVMITLYHLSDYMRGPMSNPYYVALHISLNTIAYVRLSIGAIGSIVGVIVGGLVSLRIGYRPTLVLGAIIQPIGIGAFAFLGWHGGDFTLVSIAGAPITAFEAIMTFDAFAIGFSGVALVAYMSTLTSLGYTATQYALLTSALAWTGKILKGFSGDIVESLQHGRSLLDAYAMFYLLAAAIGLPAILVCIVLARATPRPGSTRG